MPQDIKTFSELLATDPILEILIEYRIHGYVAGEVRFNDFRCMPGENRFTAKINEPLNLVSVISEFTEGSSGVEIVNYTVNGYNILPNLQHLSSSKNAYHDWRGTWEMTVPNFYRWYHDANHFGWIA